jgi:hypothetical protein
MTNTSLKLFTLAATLAIAATTASAQVGLRAAVPFSFEVNGQYTVPAGNYEVNRQGDNWIFTNQETLSKAIVHARVQTDSKPTDGARLVFSCRGNNCALRNIQTGGGEIGAYWPAPRRSSSDAEELSRVVIVPLTSSAD